MTPAPSSAPNRPCGGKSLNTGAKCDKDMEMNAINEETSASKESVAEKRQAERRLRILDAALKVFGRDGFDAARTDAIAKEAGTAKGTLYTYFSSKEEMFEEAVRARLLPLVEQAAKMQQDYDGPAEALLRLQISFFYERLIKTDLCQIMRMMIAEGARFPHLVQFYYETVLARGQATLQNTIQYGIDRGEFRDVFGPSAEKVIMGPAIMAAVWTLVFNKYAPLDLDRHLEAHLDIVLNGLKKT